MSQLIAALDDERQGVVVVGSQLMTVQDHHLGTSHLLLQHRHTQRQIDCFLGFMISHTHRSCCFLMQEDVKNYGKLWRFAKIN